MKRVRGTLPYVTQQTLREDVENYSIFTTRAVSTSPSVVTRTKYTPADRTRP